MGGNELHVHETMAAMPNALCRRRAPHPLLLPILPIQLQPLRKPTKDDPCNCQDVNNSDSEAGSWSDPDEEYYEEPWNPRYRSETNRPDTPSDILDEGLGYTHFRDTETGKLIRYPTQEDIDNFRWPDQASEAYSLAP